MGINFYITSVFCDTIKSKSGLSGGVQVLLKIIKSIIIVIDVGS